MSLIRKRFEDARKEGRAALVLYVTAGYPSIEATVDILLACERAGGDVVELGIPFSDPTADGPTIQRAMESALADGVNLQATIEVVKVARSRGLSIPVVLFGYFNPILQFGVDNFFNAAAASGVNGLLLVDLPAEERQEVAPAALAAGIDLVPLFAPTSKDRVHLLTGDNWGFVYCIARTGITGGGKGDQALDASMLDEIKKVTGAPIAIGFGVKNADDVARYAKVADGVVVGSALIKAIEAAEDPAQATELFVSRLTKGLKK